MASRSTASSFIAKRSKCLCSSSCRTRRAPTIERLLGGPAPAGGRDLLASGAGARPVYSETYYPRIHLGWSELRSLVSGSFHYIASPAPELFDLGRDVGETHNVLESQRPTAFALKNDLAAIPAAFEEAKLEASPEEVSRLAALGYLTAKAAPATGPLPDPKTELGALGEMTSAAELARAGRLVESAAKCRELLTRHPGLLDARLQLAWNLSQLGRFDEARREYAAVVERSPAHLPIVALDMARLELLAGDAAAAAAQAELAVTAFPDQARLLRGEAALARRDAAGALAEARALVAAAPTPPVAALILQARAEADLGDLTAALAHAQQAATADAASHSQPTPGVDAVLGDLLARSGRNAEAETAFRREIARFPRSLDAYANLAVLLAVQHRFAEVEATLDSLITAVPERRAFLLAARTAEDLGNRQLAETYRRRGEALR
jgi:tetratricopeptide (TPR) repeat protein